MDCPYCKIKASESNVKFDELSNLFIQEFYCFECHSLFECTSQSGDMIEENLEEIDRR